MIRIKEPDHRQLRPLRARRKRPHQRGITDRFDELAPLHLALPPGVQAALNPIQILAVAPCGIVPIRPTQDGICVNGASTRQPCIRCRAARRRETRRDSDRRLAFIPHAPAARRTGSRASTRTRRPCGGGLGPISLSVGSFSSCPVFVAHHLSASVCFCCWFVGLVGRRAAAVHKSTSA